MKTRTGFVSNSSSTSFIVGVAIIDDITKFIDWTQTNDIRVDYSHLSDIKIQSGNRPKKINDNICIKSFTGAEASINLSQALLALKESEDKIAKALLTGIDDPLVAWFSEYGNDPEWNDEANEYNYDDIDISWFDINCRKLHDAFIRPNNKNGILVGDVICGGGRDG